MRLCCGGILVPCFKITLKIGCCTATQRWPRGDLACPIAHGCNFAEINRRNNKLQADWEEQGRSQALVAPAERFSKRELSDLQASVAGPRHFNFGLSMCWGR